LGSGGWDKGGIPSGLHPTLRKGAKDGAPELFGLLKGWEADWDLEVCNPMVDAIELRRTLRRAQGRLWGTRRGGVMKVETGA
jgi:hypothetical protein